MDRKISLTGIKPSGTPHIGNYLGMIRPAIELSNTYQALYFMADYHALTTIHDGKRMRQLDYEVAATWLALGLDPNDAVLFRQSDIPEVFELTWVLACFAGKGLLNRAHAYKAIVDDNIEAGRPEDDGVNMGLYTYPVLMAADILLYGSHVVPVGQDQKQHIEMTRDMASSFNHVYGDILTIPEGLIRDEVKTIPGLDGRKMSKSYNNVIPIFAPPKQLRKAVMRIVTDSLRPEDPKDPETNNIFNIYRHFATPEQTEDLRQRFVQGGLGYGDAKQELFELLEATFGEAREAYTELMADTRKLDEILLNGADRARHYGRKLMRKIRKAVGMGPLR